MKRQSLLVLGLGLMAVVLVGTANKAAAHGGDATVIHGCITPITHLLRIVGPNEGCPLGTPIHIGKPSAPVVAVLDGAIQGQVACGTASVARSIVYVPGRSFSAITDDTGHFRLDGVPTGTYELRVEIAGQDEVFNVGAVTITAGETTDLGLLEACFVSNPNPTQCSDGLDNDADGLVDLADPGCTSASANNEAGLVFACNDGLDNDGDGLIDFPADPQCTGATDTSEQ